MVATHDDPESQFFGKLGRPGEFFIDRKPVHLPPVAYLAFDVARQGTFREVSEVRPGVAGLAHQGTDVTAVLGHVCRYGALRGGDDETGTHGATSLRCLGTILRAWPKRHGRATLASKSLYPCTLSLPSLLA